MAVLVGSVVAVIILWNYVCDELGTGRCYHQECMSLIKFKI